MATRPDKVAERNKKRLDLDRALANLKKPRSDARRIILFNLARLDIADWLASDAAPAIEADSSRGSTRDDSTGRHEEDTGARSDETGGVAHDDSRAMSTYVDQLANALGKPVFDALVKGLEADPETGPKVRQIRKSMAASHYWCSLFLALAEAVAAYGEIWDAVAGMAKQEIVRSLQPLPKDLSPLTSKVADLLVNKAVGALRAAAAGSNPIIAVLDSPQTLRALRILAIFCCPSPPKHPGIEQNCVKPLLDDGEEMLRDETRSRLANAFGLADRFTGRASSAS